MRSLYESILDNDFDISDEDVLRSILKEIQDIQLKYWSRNNKLVKFDIKRKKNKNILHINTNPSSPAITPTAYIDSDAAQLLETCGISDIQSEDESITVSLAGGRIGDKEISGINITAHTVEIDCYLNRVNITAHTIEIPKKKYSIKNCNIIADNLSLLYGPASWLDTNNSKITILEYIKLFAVNMEDILKQYGLWFWNTRGRQVKTTFSKKFIKNTSNFDPLNDLLKSPKISNKPHIYIGYSWDYSFPDLIFKSNNVSNFKYWEGYQVTPATAKSWINNGQTIDCSNGYQAILINRDKI